MAFSRYSGKYMVPNAETLIVRRYVEKLELNEKQWPVKWGWMLEEYEDLKLKLDEITKKSVMVKKEERTDFRSLKPYPNSVNHEYGWVCSREEFKLEKYGPDVPKPQPLLDD